MGRFGPCNTSLECHLPDVQKQGDLIYLTYFKTDCASSTFTTLASRRSCWFIPPTPTKRLGPLPAKLTTQTEDVLVDAWGNIYITDKQWGLRILRYTGLMRRF